ncbi:IS1595 family transposase [Aromatoleum anaerobium]|nr:IS1595 family transposase [Aromatoleum anaerobium]MCK0506681.1 IS1595 family transposase [Aromatoleum anaerobium]MCK0507372.1 IS1595 family transposase [Aromatoleum anaerobium]MCK0508097.1 IS1595 family transposase [Aromatoleum anaerobium]
MKAHEFERWIEQLRALTRRQREQVKALLAKDDDGARCSTLIESRLGGDGGCPHCGAKSLYRHGLAGGLQRYRCRSCHKTFNALTGTPLARLRKREKWLAYGQAMLDSLTVRKAAAVLGVHRNTTFRWRHRFLTWAKNDRPAHLQGITEADETYLLESDKGSRRLARKPRKRGGAATQRGLSNEQVCVLVARDRTGQTLDFVTGKGQITKAQLKTVLPPVLDPDALLVSDGNPTYRYFALDTGLSHEAVNLSAGIRVRGAYHVQNVNAYHSRLHAWLGIFHGVATKYLPNYLGWRRALDAQRIRSPDTLLAAALGQFQQRTVT